MGESRFQIDNPYSGALVFERAFATRAETMAALDRAVQAQKAWGKSPLAERIALCERFCVVMEHKKDAVAREVTDQMGKPLGQAKGEVATMLARARHLISIAGAALAEEPLPPLPGVVRFIRHEPVGVVLDIAAWNYPLLIAVNVVVPAVLAGNAVLLKHARRTALTGEAFARAFAEADAPAHLVQALHADHATIAELIARPEIGFVSFTGSVRGGHEVYREGAKRFVDVGLELGGKDPVYVAADANLEHAIVNVLDGAMYNAGQSGCGVERIYVHASVYDKFIEGAAAEAKKLVLGNPLESHVSMGPMATPDAPGRLLGVIEEAKARGGRVLCGGKTASENGKGRFFEPTVVADATHAMRGLMIDESFGPIVGVAKVKDDDEAVKMMNDSPYGLTAAIWTQDQARAFRMGAQLEAGTFFMNRCDYLDPALPWTARKDSGKGESLSRYGFLSVTRRKAYNFRTQT